MQRRGGKQLGGGTYYFDAATTRRATYDANRTDPFAYSAYVSAPSTPGADRKVHYSLDVNGVKLRESRDSTEHPTSLAVTLLCDVTGSMRDLPRLFQKNAPQMMGVLLRRGYVTHPQVMVGAIGDATSDQFPIQIGQWESADDLIDSSTEHLILEGGGGGQKTESYELSAYFMARHTETDCWSKRRHKGYIFIVGDEMAYPFVKRSEVLRHIVDDGLEADIPVAQIFRELQERYDVFFLLPKNASHGSDRQVLAFWRGLLGQNVLEIEDMGAFVETVALTIGLNEGATDSATGVGDLVDAGASKAMAEMAARATSHLTGRDVVITGGGLPATGGSSVTRL